MGFEPTTTEFRSDALTDWAIRPWLLLVLRANFLQLLQFYLFVHCSRYISAIAFVSHRICFKRNIAQVITWVQRNELIHMLFTTERFLEVAIESWSEWDLNPRSLYIYIYIHYIYTTIYIHICRIYMYTYTYISNWIIG